VKTCNKQLLLQNVDHQFPYFFFTVAGRALHAPRLQVMWLVTWLVSVSPGICASPKVVCVHSNYVYKTCSMHQYELVLLPPNFHLSSTYEPTNSKSESPSAAHYRCQLNTSKLVNDPLSYKRLELANVKEILDSQHIKINSITDNMMLFFEHKQLTAFLWQHVPPDNELSTIYLCSMVSKRYISVYASYCTLSPSYAKSHCQICF